MIVFDIETGPRKDALDYLSVDEPLVPGSMKKPETIAKWIAEDKPRIIEERRQAALSKAALDAVTGEVLTAGVMTDDKSTVVLHGDSESAILLAFWRIYAELRKYHGEQAWVGFNCHQFDWPFLLRRSWVCGIKPAPIRDGRGWFLPHLVDLREIWQCKDRQQSGSLDVIARLLGVGGKTDNIGAEFYKVWKEDRPQAIKYVENDLAITRAVAERLIG